MRLLRHLFAPPASRLFSTAALERITQAIARSEQAHAAEICFAVEPALHWRPVLARHDAATRAREVFSQLRVWDTEHNNGVLVYLLLADRRIEIVADRGFSGRVEAEQWREVCTLIEQGLRAGRAEEAVMAGLDAITALASAHFPRVAGASDRDELPNRPHLL